MKSRKILFSLIALMLITLCGMYLGFFFTAKDYNVGAEQEKDQDITDLEPDENEEPDHDDNGDGGDSDIQIQTGLEVKQTIVIHCLLKRPLTDKRRIRHNTLKDV